MHAHQRTDDGNFSKREWWLKKKEPTRHKKIKQKGKV
jgi:hypothetical protein